MARWLYNDVRRYVITSFACTAQLINQVQA